MLVQWEYALQSGSSKQSTASAQQFVRVQSSQVGLSTWKYPPQLMQSSWQISMRHALRAAAAASEGCAFPQAVRHAASLPHAVMQSKSALHGALARHASASLQHDATTHA